MGSVDDHLHRPSSLFGSLTARPPTPPREAQSHHLDSLSSQSIAPPHLGDCLQSLYTPTRAPAAFSSSTHFTTTRKRVGFSSQAQYQEPPVYFEKKATRRDLTPLSLPSSTSRPVKGILKPSSTPNKLGPPRSAYLGDDKTHQVNVITMLESTLQQLAGPDRDSKVDAYIMLFRGLKTSSNLPDHTTLQTKLPVFAQFIQRDLSSISINGTLDVLLVVSAIKLLHTFLHSQAIASSIPHDFGIFFLDHCARTLQDEQTPKEVVKHLMQALFLQNFASDIMTVDRVGRLVTALRSLENHRSWKGIVQSRIIVHEKLVKQCPQQMTLNSDWLQDLFPDMLSSVANIRSAAIKLGFSAAFTLNKDRRFLSQALEFLNASLEDKRYIETFTERLRLMLHNPQQATFVPRIWSVVTLLIPNPLQWDYFHPWSKIIQLSFNNSYLQVKKEAILAWSRFTYRLHLDGRLNYRLVRDPLLSLLGPKRKGLRDSVLGSICNLYYYAFRPNINLNILDEAWDLAVAPLMQGLISRGEDDPTATVRVASILTGLINCKTRRVWRENRIMDQSLVMDEELPAIESKWLRANTSRVFDLVTPVLEKGFAELSDGGSPFQNLWQALVHSIAFASAKDVKLHDDTARFISNVFTFLLEVWTKGPSSTANGKVGSSLRFLDSVRNLLAILVEGLGLLPNPFTEKQLVLTKGNQFVLHVAQSRRSGKNNGSRRQPLHHLFCFLSNLPPGVPDDDTFAGFFASTFAPFFKEKDNKGQAELGQELLRLLPLDTLCPYGPWLLVATRVSEFLDNSQHSLGSNSSGNGGNLGLVFRDMIRVLERGLRSVPKLPWEHWQHLFQTLQRRVKDESGDAGLAIVIIEPLAAVAQDLILNDNGDRISVNCLGAANELIAASTPPSDKQAVDTARRRLWGTSNAGVRLSSIDPFDNLYKLVASLSARLYPNLESYSTERITLYLAEIKGFFDRVGRRLFMRSLMAMQHGLACWLEDKDRRITKADFPDVVEAMRSFWQRLCHNLSDISPSELQLENIEPLLCAAFRSTHRDIAVTAAEMLNCVYSSEETIPYPKTLRTVIASLGSSINTVLAEPRLLDQKKDFDLNFEQSWEDTSLLVATPARVEATVRSQPSADRRFNTPGLSNAAETGQSSPLAEMDCKGQPSKARLHQQGCQLHFAPVELASANGPQESRLLNDRKIGTLDRQQTMAGLFTEMRSNPRDAAGKTKSNCVQHGLLTRFPGHCRTSTPESDGGFGGYLTSTPTPRRGQPVVLLGQDQEMPDPPSSPLGTRGYRLLEDLRCQVSQENLLDEWQFSSSPICGSPGLAPRTQCASQPMDLDQAGDELRLGIEADVTGEGDACGSDVLDLRDVTSSQLAVDAEVIEETTFIGKDLQAESPAPVRTEDPSAQAMVTRSGRVLRPNVHQHQLTPESDKDEFVDAVTSPLPAAPSARTGKPTRSHSARHRARRQDGNSQSFSVSDSFENRLRKIGTRHIQVQIRSSPKNKDVPSYDDLLPESPEQAGGEQATEVVDDIQDCITVEGRAAAKPQRSRPRRCRQTLASKEDSSLGAGKQPPTEATKDVGPGSKRAFENISPGSGIWLKKRKRSCSVHSSGEKRRKNQDSTVAGNQGEVPDSQPAGKYDQNDAARVQTSVLYEQDISFAPNQSPSRSCSPAEQSTPQDLPAEIPELEGLTNDAAVHSGDGMAVASPFAKENEVPAEISAADVTIEVTAAHVDAVAGSDRPVHEGEVCRQQCASTEQHDVVGNDFNDLMGLLQKGMDILRSAEFTRHETYQVEDMFMDMKRELFEAERRSRK